MSEENKHTVIEKGTDFDGAISSTGAVTISGALKGELLAPALTITPSGSAHGSLDVKRLVCEGEVSGNVKAESVELSGKVRDRTVIVADTLEVGMSKPGTGARVTFGDCELRIGARPDSSGKKKKQAGSAVGAKPVA